MKNNWTTVKSKFFLRKNLKQKPSKTHCYVVCQLRNLIHYLNVLLPYTHPVVYLKCVESGIQTIVKPNKLSSVMVVCRYGFHNGVGTHVKIWWKYYPQNFCGVGSFYKSNIFMLKSQTWWWIFTFTACLSFLIKLDMASSTLPEMNLSQFYTQRVFGNNGTYIYYVLEWNWSPSIMVGACVKKLS